jgi:hypothetical protein
MRWLLLAVLLGGRTFANSKHCGPGYVYHWPSTLCLAPGESAPALKMEPGIQRGTPMFPVYIDSK